MTDAQFAAWLKNSAAIRCVLLEVNVQVGGVETTRFLSNKGYVTKPTDTPASVVYSPYITGGVQFTETLSIDGNSASLSFGDIELDNLSGDRDSWLDDIWANRSIKVFIGDVSWPRADFRQIFDGIVVGIDSKSRSKINLKLGDKMQRLNNPIIEDLLGGSTANKDRYIPVCFGEVHNVSPLLVDPTTNVYQVHNGPIEDIIEVRDNGVPVAFTKSLATGRFTLSAQPAGTVTASVQGYVSSNEFTYSQQLENSAWAKTNATILVDNTTAPDGTTTAEKVMETTGNGNHAVTRSGMSCLANQWYTLSAYVKAGERIRGRIRLGTGIGFVADASFNLSTGTLVTPAPFRRIDDVGNGWYRVSVVGLTQVGSTTFSSTGVYLHDDSGQEARVGDPTMGMYVWGLQLEKGDMLSKYVPTTTAPANIYYNTVADLIRIIASNYGKETTPASQLAYTDIDHVAFDAFNVTCPQAVGCYFSDRTNMIDAMNQLSSSVGARVYFNRAGKLTIKRIELPRPDAGTTVQPKDITQHSLSVSSLPAVQAGVQLGYCKNFTVQSNIQTGIPSTAIDLYEQEWLTATATDSSVQATYKTFTTPTMQQTLLCVAADAYAEAQRRLNIFKVQRKVLKYVGQPHLMLEQLGDSQTLVNRRFGLENGKTGQIVSVQTDWLNPHATIEVLI